MTSQFDAMGALSTHHNDTPETASRPYDVGPRRLRHRRRRRHAGARGLRARQGARRAHPSPNWSATASPPTASTWSRPRARARCAACAWRWQASTRRSTTSTPTAPRRRWATSSNCESVREVFDGKVPPLSSTKALTGHSLGAASVHEAIYCLLMMRDGFMAGSANIEQARSARRRFPDPARKPRCPAAHGDVQQLRLRRHQRHAGVPQGLLAARRVSTRLADVPGRRVKTALCSFGQRGLVRRRADRRMRRRQAVDAMLRRIRQAFGADELDVGDAEEAEQEAQVGLLEIRRPLSWWMPPRLLATISFLPPARPCGPVSV